MKCKNVRMSDCGWSRCGLEGDKNGGDLSPIIPHPRPDHFSLSTRSLLFVSMEPPSKFSVSKATLIQGFASGQDQFRS